MKKKYRRLGTIKYVSISNGESLIPDMENLDPLIDDIMDIVRKKEPAKKYKIKVVIEAK